MTCFFLIGVGQCRRLWVLYNGEPAWRLLLQSSYLRDRQLSQKLSLAGDKPLHILVTGGNVAYFLSSPWSPVSPLSPVRPLSPDTPDAPVHCKRNKPWNGVSIAHIQLHTQKETSREKCEQLEPTVSLCVILHRYCPLTNKTQTVPVVLKHCF